MERERVSIQRQRHLRPLTAAPKKTKPKAPKPIGLRPVTAAVIRTRNYSKPSLGKSHLQASSKSGDPDSQSRPTSSLDLTPIYDSEAELELIKIVGVKNDVDEKYVSLPDRANEPDVIGERKRHPSFDTWIAGSPHSSDEFDTDVEDEIPETPASNITLDPTGKLEYEEQCRKHGFIPISFLCRHIGQRNVRMRHRYLGGNATKPLALAFQHNTVTENLDLGDNYIEPEGARYLATMLKENHFIVTLNLSNNCVGTMGIEAIAEMLEVNTTLKMLSLAGNHLSDKDANYLINPLKNNTSLSSLDLSHNDFSVMGGIHLGGALGVNEGILDLDLSWNCLRKHGAVAIINGLKMNNTLEILDLGWNGVGLEGATALLKSLQTNATLKVLDLTNNRLDAKCAEKIALGLKKNVALETLILSMNPLGDHGIELILKAAGTHPSLHFLALEEMALTRQNATLAENLEKDKDMVVLHGGVGGFQRNSGVANVMKMFNMFIKDKRTELTGSFQRQDKDNSNMLQIDDVKVCLRAAGLNLTNRYLDLLVEDMDSSHSGIINYKHILSGEAFSEHSRRRPSRGFHLLTKTAAMLDDEDDADLDNVEDL